MRESGGSSGGTFYENDVVFPCGPYLVQVGFGYDKVTAPTDAIALALKQRAALGGHC